MTIEKLKKGQYFKLINGSAVLVFDGYNRFTRKYSYYRFDDINRFGEKKKGTLIITDFEF